MNLSLNARLARLSPASRAAFQRRLLERTPHAVAAISSHPYTGPVRLSFAQQRLWFVDQLDSARRVNNVGRAMRLRGELDIEALRSAVELIVDRHEALRTLFPVLDARGQPMQVIIQQDMRLNFPLLEVSGAGAHNVLLEEELRRPFDLATEIPIRGRLLRLAANDHILQLTVHHIASDGWSAGILDRELMAAYTGLVTHGAPDLTPLPIQYRDFSEWQHEQLQGGLLAGQLAYWKHQLKDAVPALRLHGTRRRPALQTFNGRRECFAIPSDLADALRGVGQRHQTTLYVTLLAAFQALLARLTHQTDVIVGSPVAGRGRPETADLIGCFINSVALRVSVQPDTRFTDLLDQVRRTVLGALSNQDLPFDRLVQELRPSRDPSRSPVFQVMFALRNTRSSALSLPRLEVVDIPVEPDAARLDLTVVMEELAGELSGFAEYNTDIFDRDDIVRLLDHFTCLLQAVATDADRALSDIPLTSEAEQQRILVDWNPHRAQPASASTIPAVFEAWVARAPSAIAVRAGGATITYLELEQHSNRAAHALQRRGVTVGSVVGVSLERSIDLVVAVVAILKAGGAYLPLNADYPRARQELMIHDTGARVVLTHEYWATLLDGSEPVDPVDVTVNAESPAYIMYTSGSTGQPKGVAVPHRAVLGLVTDTDYVQFTAKDRVAFASDFAFDAATFELWGALLNGAQLIAIDKSVLLTPRALAATLQLERITTLFLTTSAFNRCAREWPSAFSGLRHMLFGGEAADPGAVRSVLANQPPDRLLNVYGPTETTTFATWHHIASVADDAEFVPIGRPVGGTSVYVLDERHRPVPIGVVGELSIGGSRLALGYVNQHENTAERFVDDPFSSERGARLYRTGDLVRWTPDGELVFVGRVDDQIKIRGFRVEPGEVESRLALHPEVYQAAVVSRVDTVGTRQLVAYIVPRSQPGPAPSGLRSFLAGFLPDYMLPSAYVTIDRLPLRQNGKLDLDKLPAVPTSRPDLPPVFVAPRTETERMLQDIWASVLGLDQVGVQDNFFDLGGHSLLAAEVFSRIEHQLQVRLPLASLFPLPTIESQAALIGAGSSPVAETRLGGSLIPIQPLGSKPPFFCLHGIDGDVLRFELLARSMGLDQPFYAVRAYGLDDTSEPDRQVEAIAAHYVDDLCEAFDGPYLLGGFSSGATLAFEMACQLVARGKQVGLVALLDGPAPARAVPVGLRVGQSVSYLLPDLRRYVDYALEPDQRMALARFKLAAVGRTLGRWLAPSSSAAARGLSAEVLEAVAEFSERHHTVARAHHAALLRYVPPVYPGRLLLVRGEIRRLWSSHDRTLGWSELARGGVDVVHLYVRHEALLKEPMVRTVAATLNAAIGRALAAGGYGSVTDVSRPPVSTGA